MASRKKQIKDSNYYCWCIAHIDSSYLERVYTDLAKSKEFLEIEYYVPMVKILKKTFKGKDHFEDIPLMFNYGFFKIPRHLAVQPSFLDKLKKTINCIYSWVKDPVKKFQRYVDGPMLDRHVFIATTQPEVIELLKEAAFYASLYSSDDIALLTPGKIITLRTYPFENMDAEIIEVFEKKQKVKVVIEMMDARREVMVDFNNVFFTIYHNRSYDDSISVKDSLDAMQDGGTLDKKLYKKSLVDGDK